MIQDTLVHKYIDTIDLYKVDVAEDLLVLYRIGAGGKEEKIKELQLHNGYQQTLKRYLLNKSSLTPMEVLGILELYALRDAEFTLPYGYYVVSIPTPNIRLHHSLQSVYGILYLPKPNIRYAKESIFGIASVPGVNVSKEVPLSVSYIPKPNVNILHGIQPYGILQTPLVNVVMHGHAVQISSIPKPNMRFIEEEIDGHAIVSIPKPNIMSADEISLGNTYYYGVHQTGELSTPRPTSISFEGLIKVHTNTIESSLEIDFPRQTGYYIFAIPATAPLKKTWYISQYNSGMIGGSPEPIAFSNLWPDPLQQTYAGITYNVYVTSYATSVNEPIILSAQK